MAKAIGPTFYSEIEAAGLVGLPFSWDTDGNIHFNGAMTDAQQQGVLAAYAAHDPTKKLPATFLSRDLVALLTPEDQANIALALDDELANAKAAKASGQVPSAPLRLLWAALQAQGDAPIETRSARFHQGWSALSQVLGPDRSTTIAAALGIA